MLRRLPFAFLSLAFVACSVVDDDGRPDSKPMVDVTDADGSKVAESAEGEGNPVGARPALGFMPGYESSEPGVPVNMVTEGGPAEKAGMQAGDQIVELNGEELFDINDYVAVLNALRIGSKVEVKIMRDGKANKLNVVVGER